jgi:hypothetical protein
MYVDTSHPVTRQEIHAPRASKTSRLLVSTLEIDGSTYVMLDESENVGPGLSSSADYVLPILVERMGLDWTNCVFIDVYRSTELNLDAYYDVLYVNDPESVEIFGYGVLQRASFQELPFAPIGLELAGRLRQAGYPVGNYLGRSGWFSLTGGDDLKEVEIADYDGRRYYDPAGILIPGWLRQLEA